MTMKKNVLTGALLLASVVTLAACSAKEEKATTEETKTEMTAKEASAWKDGTYSGESSFDDYGYKKVQTITIKDGKITESTFDYEDKDGQKKSANEEYNTNMKEKAGVSAQEAIEQLNKNLVSTQKVADVEVVTGATHTSEDFKKATEALLKAAEEGNTETVTFD